MPFPAILTVIRALWYYASFAVFLDTVFRFVSIPFRTVSNLILAGSFFHFPNGHVSFLTIDFSRTGHPQVLHLKHFTLSNFPFIAFSKSLSVALSHFWHSFSLSELLRTVRELAQTKVANQPFRMLIGFITSIYQSTHRKQMRLH